MAGIKDLATSADLLQKVDVSEIFTSLATGIATAQEKLDDNSIKQLTRLTEQQVAGKSLLELGFQPAFYAFTEATISASLNLKMAMKEEFSVAAKLNIAFAKGNNLSQTELDFLKKNSKESSHSEFKSTKQIDIKASSKTRIKVNESYKSLDQEEGCISMLEDFQSQLMAEENIDYVENKVSSDEIQKTKETFMNVNIVEGLLCISESIEARTEAIGLLKIKDNILPNIDIDGSGTANFDLVPSLEVNIGNIKTALNDDGEVYGLSKDGKYYYYFDGVIKNVDTTLFFKHDDSSLIFDEPLDETEDKQNASAIFNNIFKVLGFIASKDPNANIKFKGYTDTSGLAYYNKKLGQKRADAYRNEIIKNSKKFEAISLGESQSGENNIKNIAYRKAEVSLDADYIIIINGNLSASASPNPSSAQVNKFIYLEEHETPANPELDIKYKGVAFKKSNASSEVDTSSYILSQSNNHHYELRNNVNHFMQKDTLLSFRAYNESGEEIKMEVEKQYDENGNEKTETVLIQDISKDSKELNNDTSDYKSNKTFALNAELDVRYARQFEMSMEGSASMSAKMVALPAPAGLIKLITPNPTVE